MWGSQQRLGRGIAVRRALNCRFKPTRRAALREHEGGTLWPTTPLPGPDAAAAAIWPHHTPLAPVLVSAVEKGKEASGTLPADPHTWRRCGAPRGTLKSSRRLKERQCKGRRTDAAGRIGC